MLSGLQACCYDLRCSADHFFAQQQLHDILVQSTLGLTDDDLKILSQQQDVVQVSGFYEENVHVKIDQDNHSATVKSFVDGQIDTPYLIEGDYPKKPTEILVSALYIKHSGQGIGDQVVIEEEHSEDEDDDDFELEDDEPNFKHTTYTISGICVDPTDINQNDGGTSFRSTATTDYVFYVPFEAIDSDVYTAIGMAITDNDDSLRHQDDYSVHCDDVLNRITQTIKSERESARTKEVKKTATEKLDDAEADMYKEFAKAEKKLNKAKKKLNKAKKDLVKGKKELDDGKKELDQNKKKLADNEKKANREFKKAQKKLTKAKKQIKSGEKQLKKAKKQLSAQKKQLLNAKAQIDAQSAYVDYMSEEEKAAYYAQKEQVEAGLKQIYAGEKELNRQSKSLKSNKRKITQGLKTLKRQKKTTKAKLKKAKKQIDKGYKDYYKGVKEYNDGLKDYQKGLKKYKKNAKKYKKEKKDAIAEVADAREDIASLDKAQWYLQNRSYMSGYTNVISDAGSIESLAVIFSILFIIVALLMCMTTVNRLVDEERGLIGTYQALGFNDHEIRLKYMAYAGIAAFVGCILGNLAGFIGFPVIIFTIFHSMYQFPYYTMHYLPLYGIGGSLLFLLSVVATVAWTCRATLKEMPASLMRPRSPKAGSRVLLERITPIWNHLSFLNKVTARNLFRYKKRLFMTIIGIAGCTSLLVVGFAINDSVNNLIYRQYDVINHYDYLGIVSKDNDDFGKMLDGHDEIKARTALTVESVTLKNHGDTQVMTLYVFPDDVTLSDYISLNDHDSHETLKLGKEGLYTTKNAGIILGFKKGDTVTVQNLKFESRDVKVTALVENYLGNALYMSQSFYESLFDDFETNAQMVIFKDHEDAAKTIDEIKQYDDLISSVSTDELRDTFSESVKLIHVVVVLLVVMSAALAFAVLFTLSATNISERVRELATIKVLGFFDPEVHLYVNKETLILTSIGIILGVPFGILFSHSLTTALKMPSLYFAVYIKPFSYFISIAIAAGFALAVNIMTNQTLNDIDPIVALKSVE